MSYQQKHNDVTRFQRALAEHAPSLAAVAIRDLTKHAAVIAVHAEKAKYAHIANQYRQQAQQAAEILAGLDKELKELVDRQEPAARATMDDARMTYDQELPRSSKALWMALWETELELPNEVDPEHPFKLTITQMLLDMGGKPQDLDYRAPNASADLDAFIADIRKMHDAALTEEMAKLKERKEETRRQYERVVNRIAELKLQIPGAKQEMKSLWSLCDENNEKAGIKYQKKAKQSK